MLTRPNHNTSSPDNTILATGASNRENMVWLFHTHSKSWRCGIFRLSTKKVPEVVLLLSLNHKIVAPENITILSVYKLKNWTNIIYIIITKNICYLLWNKGLWRSLNNTYPIFLTPCIRCTNHLYDSYDLTDVIRHFILSLFKMLNYCDVIDTRAGRQQLWRHNDRLFPRGCYGRFLSTMMRTVITAQWATENISCFNYFA